MSMLTDFRMTAIEQTLGVYGIHVFKGKEVVAQHRFRSDDRVNLCSASKTFVSIGVGIAQAESRIQLTDSVLDYFPEYKSIAQPGSEQITIKNLLQMQSGHLSENFERYNQGDRAELFFQTTMDTEAGNQFFYEDLNSYMLGRVVEKSCGETMLRYLKPRLFQPLGIVNPQWHTCNLEHTACSGGLYLTTEEFSRIGVLMLQKGWYKEQLIVPEDYIAKMHTDLVDSSSKNDPETKAGYGYQVWNCTQPGAFRADGMYGQICIVLQDQDAVVTVTAHNELEHKDIIRVIWKDILPLL
ncbi:MAG: serine hydrolase [Lachnospiraceae bacterium]|nr:serine hydrolase [Lachnospiraceae bacterium]